MRTSILALAVTSVLAAPPVRAETADAPSPPRETRWYGWQNLAMDGVAFGFLGGGVLVGTRMKNVDSDVPASLALFGAIGWVTFSPIVHVVHHRSGIALASLGLRIVPLVVLAASMDSWSCGGNLSSNASSDPTCSPSVTGPLLAIGTTTALVLLLDDVVLAREDFPREQARRFTPTISFARAPDGRSSTPTFGIAGAF